MELTALFDSVNQIQVDAGFAHSTGIDNVRADNMLLSRAAKSIPCSPKKSKKKEASAKAIKQPEGAEKADKDGFRQNDRAKKRNKEDIIEVLDDIDVKQEKDKDADAGKEGIDAHVGKDHGDNYGALAQFQDYLHQLEKYRQFLDNYLKESSNASRVMYSYSAFDTKKKGFEWGQEVAGYSEIKETVRKIKMNILLGGWHNDVSPDDKERYKFWKYVSKFNKVMAEVIETSVGSGG